MDELIHELLQKRGITTEGERDVFLHSDYERDVHDPFLLTDMKIAVERIVQAIDTDEHIAIYSDFDADGIPAGALLYDVFKKIGHKRFINYIPHRDREGYGFHCSAVDTLHEQGVTLIITVDVGITGHEAVAHAKDLGIDVIVTDHHIPSDTLPIACAVINPQRLDDFYPNIHLCGSGVAYKLVQALLLQARLDKKEWVQHIPDGWEKWLLDLVAIATVADMMSLVGENRALVHFGLQVLHKGKRRGLLSLYRKLGLKHQYITEDDIGFSIAPRINASSRMGSPETAFALLTTTDDEIAQQLAKELEQLNNKRKGTVAHIVKELHERFKDAHDDDILVAGNPEWNPALIGLAANSLVDTYNKTVCLWGRDGAGTLKGSCRSSGDVHIVELLKEMGNALISFGGHEYAGGFAVSPNSVHTLQKVCNDVYKKVNTKNKSKSNKKLIADAPLPSLKLHEVHAILNCLAPFGIDNGKPIFQYQKAYVHSVRQFGKEQLHLEAQLKDSENSSTTVRAIAFFKNASSFTKNLKERESVDVFVTVELSRFAGAVRYELRILDVQ